MNTNHGPALASLTRRPGHDLLGIDQLPLVHACRLLAQARAYVPMVDGDRVPGGAVVARRNLLDGHTVINLFGEPSTRTRTSFEIAASRMGATVINFFSDGSTSAVKGETPLDTVLTLDAMGASALVMRDRRDRFPHELAQGGRVRARIVNAGDGRNEHPTQALLDALTIIEAFDRDPNDGARTLAGLTVAICGDIRHGRVAHSGMLLLRALGAEVRVAGPAGLIDADTEERYGASVVDSLEQAVAGAHVVMMLRIQRERLAADLVLPDAASYHAVWGLTRARLRRADARAIVMHPGPLNRGVEIASDVADGPASRILRQVSLGVAVRMAALARACGVGDWDPAGARLSV